MPTQYTFGVEDKTEEDLLKLLPSRFSKSALTRLRGAELLTRRNIVLRLQGSYQSLKDARMMSDYLAAIEQELTRRDHFSWLSIPCQTCKEYLRIETDRDGELVGYCCCTDNLNTSLTTQ